MIKGFADLTSTKEYFIRRNINKDKLRMTDYFCNLPIGMGNHLGDFSDKDSGSYFSAMVYGVEHGINLIDTAINYRGMRSEKDVGRVLNYVLRETKVLKREEIIVSSKAGEIFGDITSGIKPYDYLSKVLIPRGIVQMEDLNIFEGAKFTMKSSFYRFSIEKSRQNLNLDTIDIHYIHNPEVNKYIMGNERFYDALKKLFIMYETEVMEGHIKFYGIASWKAFIVDEDSPWYISIEKIKKIADEIVGKGNHLKFLQLPYNIYRTEAAEKKNQIVNGEYKTPLEAANEFGFKVMISTPLNKYCKGERHLACNMLKFVTDTDGVYSAMVGSKSIKHIKENIDVYK